ncbi:hypothetical protein FACS1894208_10450 [Clostridia bacterium]|nr:hypothetical protein FACS1894208_10450 [Clostridia bacterium]
MILRQNECFINAGCVTLPASNGELLPIVPQYKIVRADTADPALVADAQDGERFVLAGLVFTDRQRAEERFSALKAGQTPPPRERGTPLYFKESTANLNRKTGQTPCGETIIKALAVEFAELFAAQIQNGKEAEHDGHV